MKSKPPLTDLFIELASPDENGFFHDEKQEAQIVGLEYANIPLNSQVPNQELTAEAIQSVLRREGFEKPYELLKDLTRTNEGITEQSVQNFILSLNVSDTVKEELKAITPHNYAGIQLVK